MNGDQHRRNRRIVKEPFGLRAISNYGGTILRLTDDLLATWRAGDVRDIAEEMRQYMLRVTSTLLFGMDDPEAACRLGDLIARQEAGETPGFAVIAIDPHAVDIAGKLVKPQRREGGQAAGAPRPMPVAQNRLQRRRLGRRDEFSQ